MHRAVGLECGHAGGGIGEKLISPLSPSALLAFWLLHLFSEVVNLGRGYVTIAAANITVYRKGLPSISTEPLYHRMEGIVVPFLHLFQ